MYKIFRTRKIKPFPCIWNGISQTSPLTKKIHGAAVTKQWNYFDRNGFYTGIDFQQEWDKTEKAIKNRILTDNRYLPYIYNRQLQTGRKMVNLSEKISRLDLPKFKIEQLWILCKNIQTAWLEFDRINVTPWLVGGDALQAELKTQAEQWGVSEKEFLVLATATQATFSSIEELKIFRIAIKIKNQKDLGSYGPRITKSIQGLVRS